ncbi:MAG: hypothetical protein ACJ762_17285 [Solirubrobacteraceae bacterium]
MRGERGQGTIEYLAVVLVVAGVMAAAIAVLAVTGLGAQVMREFRHALCVVTGGACDEAVRAAAGPCVLGSARHADGGQLTILMVRSGENDVVLREQRSDGTVALALIDGDALGLDFGTGAGAHVRWGQHAWAVGGELRAAVLAGARSGRTWIAHDAAEAESLFARVRVANALPGGRGKLPIPDADVTFAERSGGLTMALRPDGRRGIELSSEEAYGERIDHRSGRRTVYVRDALGGRGKVSFGSRSVSGAAAGEERFGITFDRSGRPVDLVVLSTLDIDGAANLPSRLSRIAGLLKIPLHGGKHVETEQHLDLTDPGNAEVAEAFLGRTGEGRLGVRLVAAALRERLEQHGTLSVRTYDRDGDERSAGGHVKLAGIGVGVDVGSEDESAHLVAAIARQPDGTWGEDPACVVAA